MAGEVKFTVPLVPPSVNTYTRHSAGKHFKTEETYAFENAMAIYARDKWVHGIRFVVTIDVYLGHRQGRDIDNLPKCVLDGLSNAGVFRAWSGEPLSDNYVDDLHVRKHRSDRKNPRTEITVRAL